MKLKDLPPGDQARVRACGVPWRLLEQVLTAGLSLDEGLQLAAARAASGTPEDLACDAKLVAMGVPVTSLVRWAGAGVYTFFPAVTGRNQVTPLTVEQVTRLFDMGGTGDLMSYSLTRGSTADALLELLELVGDQALLLGVPLDVLGLGVHPQDCAWLATDCGVESYKLSIAPRGEYPTPETMPDTAIRRMVLLLASLDQVNWPLPAAMTFGRALEMADAAPVAELVTAMVARGIPAQAALEVYPLVKDAPESVLDTLVRLVRDGLDPHEATRLALADEKLEEASRAKRRLTVRTAGRAQTLAV